MIIGPLTNVGVPNSAIGDTIVPTTGTNPISLSPNIYLTGDDYRTIAFTTTAASLDIWAISWNSNTNGAQTLVGVVKDKVYSQTLTYAGTQGIKQKQTLALDGALHTIVLFQLATVTDIVGKVTYISPTPPGKRVVINGDSKSYGINASVLPQFAWPSVLRLGIGPGYGVTDWGTSGKTMFGNAGQGPLVAARCDGVSENIEVLVLDINDFIQGVTNANYVSALSGIIASSKANVAGIKILLMNSPQTFATPILGGGITQAQIQTAMVNAAAADPTNVFFSDCLTTLFPGGTPWATDYAPDGVHFTDAGHAKQAVRALSAIQAIP